MTNHPFLVQQCTLARCIGTLTNQNRPLCGIGQTGQAIMTTYVVLLNAAWNIFIESLTTMIGLGLDDSSNTNVQVSHMLPFHDPYSPF